MCKHVCSQKHYLQRLTTLRAVVHTHTHTHIHAHIHTHTHAHTHRLTHSHTHTHTHTHQTSSRSLGRCKHGPRRTSQTTQIQTYHCRSQRHMALCAVHNSYLLKGHAHTHPCTLQLQMTLRTVHNSYISDRPSAARSRRGACRSPLFSCCPIPISVSSSMSLSVCPPPVLWHI